MKWVKKKFQVILPPNPSIIFLAKTCAKYRLYFLYVSLFKLFMGATAWQYAAYLYDGKTPNQTGIGSYIFRAVLVGFADATFCCLGALISELIEKGIYIIRVFVIIF